jgi:hypothetical protein
MTNKKKEEFICEHSVNFTPEEEEAIRWLQHSLGERAKECNPTSRVSGVAHRAVGKLFKKLADLHREIHEVEADLEQTEMLVTGIAGLPHAMGLVKEEDLN